MKGSGVACSRGMPVGLTIFSFLSVSEAGIS